MLKYDFLLCLKEFLKKILILLQKNKTFCEFYMNYKKKRMDAVRKEYLKHVLVQMMNEKPFPLPVAIEIETLNRCNADCDFCPVNRHLDKREYKVMDNELFYSIIKQLKELNYSGYIAPYSNNEPLLDERIFDFVSHIKQELPNAKKFLFTNGLLLNLDKFLKLIPNLDFMVIDHYWENKLVLRENIKKIAQYCFEHPEVKDKVKIQLIDKHMIRNNRAGEAKNRKFNYKIQASCLWPFSQMVIRPTGQISLCCNDALGQITMGDLTKEKLIDVWRGEKYQKLRESLLETRSNVKLCSVCDSFGLTKRGDVLEHLELVDTWDIIKKLI